MVTRREGYHPFLPEGMAELGELQFLLGERAGVAYEAKKSDVLRTHAAIAEATKKADYVIVSIHSHQLLGGDKTAVPEFLSELCRGFIDAGADAVIGHGPHLLRPVEVYKEKPIFYSLGDFVIELYDVSIAPEDFYRSYGMDSNSPVIDLLEKRSAGFTRGLMEDDRMLETVIPYWETDSDKKLTKMTFMPVKASKGEGKILEGLPRPAKNTDFMQEFSRMSEPYGVNITFENGEWVGKW